MLNVSLTFDDGTIDQYGIARVLELIGVRGTFFIITGLREFEGKQLLAQYPRLILRVHNMGHEVGSHTRTHPDLTTLSNNEAAKELSDSKEFLQNVIGQEVRGFAYPWGRHSHSVRKAVARMYWYGRATRRCDSKRFDRYAIPVDSLNKARLISDVLLNTLRRNDLQLVLLFHEISTLRMLLVVYALKLLGARFLTLDDLQQHIHAEERVTLNGYLRFESGSVSPYRWIRDWSGRIFCQPLSSTLRLHNVHFEEGNEESHGACPL